MPSVRLNAVHRTHRSATRMVHALRGLTLEIADGELLVILGPSGSGKTTTLRILAGLDAPDAGEVWVGDRPMAGVPPERRNVAMVFQDHPLLPHLDVAGNIRFGLRLRRCPGPEIEVRVRETADALGLTPLLGRLPHELSGGERQRVALAAALAIRPELLLLDEPLGQLDAPLRLELRRLIKRLQRSRGLTVVHVTHDQAEAMALADRIAVLDGGTLMQVAPPSEAYQRPANTFVARFLGAPPMNLLPGRIRESDREPCWHPASGPALPLPGIPLPPAGEFFLAIRPECISPFAADASHASARVEAIEHLGDHWLVHLDLGGGTLVAKCADAPPVREGDTCGMGFAANHVLFFDAKTGKRHPAP